ncbi:DUF397 domain-containing protein [Nocardiopsis sp. RSe5-2]|uniref:DUF397 domain-containing protein n=1 Tax=Nocardiopsis endophytica TaxID=3018445 RepID=A0ABT4U3R1_9ACTN|nr:DUF397 domain-containing protein [Nocardiopsis endophytica]MDA2811570.1 DUF397 domain-containing protein [Nocardiopsis endophytica]
MTSSEGFRKSSYSQPQNCVEVADSPGRSAVRDTKYRSHATLHFPSGEWAAFVRSLRAPRPR